MQPEENHNMELTVCAILYIIIALLLMNHVPVKISVFIMTIVACLVFIRIDSLPVFDVFFSTAQKMQVSFAYGLMTYFLFIFPAFVPSKHFSHSYGLWFPMLFDTEMFQSPAIALFYQVLMILTIIFAYVIMLFMPKVTEAIFNKFMQLMDWFFKN